MLITRVYTRDVRVLLCASWFVQTVRVHLLFAQTTLVRSCLHELHLCILVARARKTHFTCFIAVHSGLPYTRIIHSKLNTCVRTYYYTTESIHTFYKFRAGNVNCYTFE